MSLRRQLSAIMFTDIVGYTALMGEDEQKAFNLLRKNREIQQPIIKDFNGTWIKELGDGVLVSFYNVSDALLCAICIEQAVRNISDLKLRIGIHLGEIMFENNDVFGDGVNIASRIQALAPIGGVWISGAVNEIVANQKEFTTRFVRNEVLKNVKEPVPIYELDTTNVIKEQIKNREKANQRIPEKSVAVLPFLNLSNDPDQEYFSDGIAEEIINSIAHVRGVKVAGRMSSFQFKGEKGDLREIGEKLGVNTVLEGSVRRQGRKIRITAQLINVKDGFPLWSERYDRNVDDIFAIQDDIALAITEKLKITLLKKSLVKIVNSPTQNASAYELYLKGRFFLNRRGSSIQIAINYFQQAIDIDNNFALAHSGYADAQLLLATYGLVSPRQVMEKVKLSAERAMALDPSRCEPYCSLGCYYNNFEWNWTNAKKNYLKSLELNPQYCQAHNWYGYNYLSWVEGKFDEAEKHGKILIKIEPLNAICYGSYSLILQTAKKLKNALDICQMGIELDSTAFLCRLNEGHIYMAMQENEKAIISLESAVAISNNHHFAVNGLIWNYCIIGDYDKAGFLMNNLKKRSENEYVASTFTGISAAYLGNMDEAFAYLEKAYDDHEPLILALKYETWGPSLFRKDPRFKKLLDRIEFPE